MTLDLRAVLLILAIILFLLSGLGVASLVAFGLAAFAAAFLVRGVSVQ